MLVGSGPPDLVRGTRILAGLTGSSATAATSLETRNVIYLGTGMILLEESYAIGLAVLITSPHTSSANPTGTANPGVESPMKDCQSYPGFSGNILDWQNKAARALRWRVR